MSRYSVSATRSAAKALKTLPKGARARIAVAISALADDPRPHGHKTLDGKKKLYRIRVGAYRVVYQVRDGELIVLIIRVGDRKEVYRRLAELMKRTDPPA